jgi:fibronectin-binding autotransporter adhesin
MNWQNFKKNVLLSSTFTALSLGSLHAATCSDITSISQYSNTIDNINSNSCQAPVNFSANPGDYVTTSTSTTITNSSVNPINFTSSVGTINLQASAPITELVGISGSGLTINLSPNILLGTGSISASAGTLQFSDATTWASLSNVSLSDGGTLDFQSTTGTITSTFSISSSGIISTAGTITASGVISGSGSLTKSGTGTLTLSAVNTLTGGVTISSGVLALSGAGSISNAASLSIPSGSTLSIGSATAGATIQNLSGAGTITLGSLTLNVSESSSSTFSGIITGSGGLNKSGTGTLILSGANSYSGNTSITAGTLSAGATNTLPSTTVITLSNTSAVALNLNGFSNTISGLSGGGTTGGNVTLGSATLTISSSSTNSYAGSISGSGGITKSGTGTQTLTAEQLYTGPTSITAGTLSLSTNGDISSSSSVTVNSPATLNIASSTLSTNTINNLSGNGTVEIGANNLFINETTDTTFSGGIGISGDTGGIIKTGSSKLTLSGSSGTSLYQGTTLINEGTLQSGATGTFPSTTLMSFANTSGAILNLDGFSNSITGLLGGGTTGGNVTLGAATLTIVIPSTRTYGGIISGAGNLLVSGAGTQTLTGINTYSGTTVLSSGSGCSLALSGSGSISNSSSLTVGFSTSFTINNTDSGTSINTLDGFGSIILGSKILTITELVDSTFSGGISGQAGGVTGTGGIIKMGSETLTFTAAAGLPTLYSGDSLIKAGTIKAGSTNVLSPQSVFVFLNVSGALLDINDFSNTIAGLSGGGTTGGWVDLGTNASITLTLDTVDSEIYAGIISGAGSILVDGSGTQTFTGTNTYIGSTTVDSGTLYISGAGSITASSAVEVNSPGVLSTEFGTQDTTIRNLSGDGSVVVGNNTLTIAEGSSTTFSGVISNSTTGVGGISKIGASTLTLSGVNTLTGPVAITQGALSLSGSGSIAEANLVSIANSASLNIALSTSGASVQTLTSESTATITLGTKTLTIVPTEDSTFQGVISSVAGAAAGGIQVTGPNVITFTGLNTFTGPTTITQGTLSLSGTGSISTSNIVTVNSPGTLSISDTSSGATVKDLTGSGTVTLGTQTLTINETSTSTFSGSIQGLGNVSLTGPGPVARILTLTGTNLYTGSTSILASTLALSGSGSIAPSSSLAISSGAAFSISGTTSGATIQTISGAGSVTLGDQALTVIQNSDQTLSGVISGTNGSFLKAGSSTLTISGTSNTYSGTTGVVAGTLRSGATNSLSPNSSVVFTDATSALLDLNDFDNAVPNISGGGTSGGWIDLGTATLTVGSANANATFSGIIYDNSEGGSLTKLGTGALGLGGLNTYSGTTTISAGSLKAEIENAFSPNSTVTLANTLGAALDLNDFANEIPNVTGGGLIGGWINLGSGILGSGILTTGSASVDATYDGKIYGTGGIIKTGTATFTLTNPSTYTGTTVIESGTLALTNLGSISSSSSIEIADDANFDISGITPATSTSINTLLGAGNLEMGTLNLTINQNADGGFSGIISGSGDLTVQGTMVLGLSGVNTYSGTTTISESATLALSGLGDISSSSSLTIGSSATLNTVFTNGTTVNDLSGSGSIVLGFGILTLDQSSALTFSGSITEANQLSGSLTKTGAATLTLSGSADFSGNTTISQGAIDAGATSALSANSVVVFADVSGVALNLSGFNNTVGGLSGGGSTGGDVTLGSAILTIDTELDQSYAARITGVGGIVKTGAATQTFTGVNTYFSSTVISEGTLALEGSGSIINSNEVNIESGATLDISGVNSSAVIGRLSGSGTASLGTKTLTVNQTVSNTTFSGDITGTGPFMKAGSKKLTLSSIISHTGPTIITAGTLSLEKATAISASESVVLTAGTLDISTAGATLNTLSGTGGVVQLGNQTLTAISTANSTFSGSIRGTGGNIIVQAGDYNFQLGGISTFTGTALIESGILSITGSGSISTAESLTISSGTTLQIGNTTSGTSISTPMGSGTIALGSQTLTILQRANSTFSGVINGTGGLIKQRSNTLTLDGASTFSGGVSLVSGQITLANNTGLGVGGTLSMTDGTTLDLNDEISAANPISLGIGTEIVNVSTGIAALDGAISGSGGLNKTGDGTLILNGVGTFTGDTTITSGLLSINNSFASSITVNADSILGGNVETTGSITVLGTLKPGNSAGDILGANITLEPGSKVIISLESNDHSRIEATGTLSIDPSTVVTFFAEPGYDQFNQQLPFATAGSVVGQFAKSLTNAAILDATLAYTSTDITVSLSIISLDNVLPPGNALSTWHAISTVLESGDNTLNPILATLYPLSLDEVAVALNQMQPAQFKGLTISQENNIVKVQDTLGLRLEEQLNVARCTLHKSAEKGKDPKHSCDRDEKTFQAWIDGFGDTLHQGSNYTAASPQTGYQTETGGIVAGFDYHFASYYYAGALGGYTSSDISWANGQGSGDIQSGYAGLYFAAMNDFFFATTSAIGSWNSYSAKRNILYPGVSKTAKNDHGGSQFLFNFDLGANLGYGNLTVRPFNSFDYITQSENSFTETGAGPFNLYIDNVNAIMLRNELGLQFASCMCFKNSKWTISPKFSWVREVRIKGENTMTQFASTTVPFKVTGYFPNRNLFSPGVSVTSYWLEDALALELYYSGEYGQKYSDSSYGGQIRFGF